MKVKTKQLFINLSVLLITLCLLVLIVEIFVRKFAIELDDEKWRGNPKEFYEYDSLLGWRKIPNTNKIRISVRGKNKVLYQINSKGIRGNEYSYKKTADEYRILILGDSFADGYKVEFDNLFSEVLKRKFNANKKHKNFQVINTGTIGWSTDQELLFFQHEGKKYDPDLVVLMFYQNDIAYNNQPKDWSMYYKPLFKIKEGELVLTNVPVPKPDIFIYDGHLEPKEKPVFKRIRYWLHTHSYLYLFVKKRMKNSYILRKLAKELHLLDKPDNAEEQNTPDNDERALPNEFRVWEKNYNDTVRASWKITEAMLIKLQEEVSSIGSRLLVFYIPFEASIYKKEWEKLKRVHGLSDDKYNADKAGIVLNYICKRNNIDFMNPTIKFKKKAAEMDKYDKRLYNPNDHHWTVEGNIFTGEILAEFISSRYLKANR